MEVNEAVCDALELGMEGDLRARNAGSGQPHGKRCFESLLTFLYFILPLIFSPLFSLRHLVLPQL